MKTALTVVDKIKMSCTGGRTCYHGGSDERGKDELMTISIVVPCYNEAPALLFFYAEFCKLKEEFTPVELELILVNDGSTDATLAVMRKLAMRDSAVHYISLSRNFGKEAAMLAGLETATGDYVAIMDADLQDPPSLLVEMYHILANEDYDSVATRRVTRKGEPPIRSFFARTFYHLINKVSKIELVDGVRDYRLMNRRFVNALLSLKENNRFSKGLFAWVGFKTKYIEFENVERIAGDTKWSFWGLVVYAIEGIVSFTTVPLVVATILGLLCCLGAFGEGVYIIVKNLIFNNPVPGWASLASFILLLGGVQLLCIGVLGQYLAKAYLEVKKRPIYIVAESNIREK